jgi:hypothetical protein
MKVNQFILVLKVKVLVITKVLMAEEVLVITKSEVTEGITVAHMPRKVELNVLGVMTNDKPKLRPIRVFESSDG